MNVLYFIDSLNAILRFTYNVALFYYSFILLSRRRRMHPPP